MASALLLAFRIAAADWDAALFQKLNGAAGHHPVLDAAMIRIANYSPYVFAVILAAAWLRWRRDVQEKAFVAGLSALIALGLGQIVGMLVPRLRPYQVMPATLLVPHAPDVSFPSDHATLAFAVSIGLWGVSRRLGVVLLIFSLCVAVARVYIGAHYPTDVIGGAILGGAVASAMSRLTRTGKPKQWLDRLFDVLWRLRVSAAN